MRILEDLNTYLMNLKEPLSRLRELVVLGSRSSKEPLIEALTLNNFYLTELLLLKNYFSDFTDKSAAEIVRNKSFIKQLDEHMATFRMLNSSLTALLRAVTLDEKYKQDTSNLEVILENEYGILYFDRIQDYSLLLHKRSGVLEKFQKPYLTRKENKALAEKLFTKLKNLENTK